MLRHLPLSMGLLLGTTLLSGCSYDRSFMQMDSNSGLPFFGFQWAVDSGSRPSKSASTHDDDRMAPALIDLRAPSTLDQPGGNHLDLDVERDDIQTVSISPRTRTRFVRSSDENRPTAPEQVPAMAQDSGSHRVQSNKMAPGVHLPEGRTASPIRAFFPESRSSSAAKQFQNRRAAF